MQLGTFTLLLASIVAVCVAAPANHNGLEKRQDTFIITCIGANCDDGPTPAPKPSKTSKPNPPKSSKTPTPDPHPEPTPVPSKTVPKPTPNPTKTTGEEVGPSSTRCPVPLYYQCGGYYDGQPWKGCTKCVKGAKCVPQNEFYNQCVTDDGTASPALAPSAA